MELGVALFISKLVEVLGQSLLEGRTETTRASSVRELLGSFAWAGSLLAGLLVPGFIWVQLGRTQIPQSFIEAETVSRQENCSLRAMTDRNNGGSWSKDSFVKCKFSGASGTARFEIPSGNGRYRVLVFPVRHTSAGVASFSVNGHPSGVVAELWQGGSIYSPSPAIDLGEFQFASGSQELEISLTSAGKGTPVALSIDGFALEPVDQAAHRMDSASLVHRPSYYAKEEAKRARADWLKRVGLFLGYSFVPARTADI